MRMIVLAVAVTMLGAGGQAPTSKATGVAMVDSIQGTSVLAIQAALPRFESNGFHLADYRIEVLRESDTPHRPVS